MRHSCLASNFDSTYCNYFASVFTQYFILLSIFGMHRVASFLIVARLSLTYGVFTQYASLFTASAENKLMC